MTRALVIGRAAGVWDDVKAAHELIAPARFDVVVAVNVSGCDYPGEINHWVTFHVASLDKWVQRRLDKGFPLDYDFWTSPSQKHLQKRTIHPLNFIDIEGGSSGFLATFVALKFAQRVVLAGIPMVQEMGQYDTNKEWLEAKHYRAAWQVKIDKGVLSGTNVRSLSGWTMEQFGAPTPEWLMEEEDAVRTP